jgi:hypothetical protein
MSESARHLVEQVFGARPVRQWVLRSPCPLRSLFAGKPDAIGPVPGFVHRVIADRLAAQAGVPREATQCGAVTLSDGAQSRAPPVGRTACVPSRSPADSSHAVAGADEEGFEPSGNWLIDYIKRIGPERGGRPLPEPCEAG